MNQINPSTPEGKGGMPKKERSSALTMLVCYMALYGLFIWMCVFRPEDMARRVRDTVTLATAYGMVLIISAAIFALMYVRKRK